MSAVSCTTPSDAGRRIADELLSLEALLVSRTYAYTLFHKALGGEPDEELIAILSSPETADVFDEYADESEVLTNLKTFVQGLSRKAEAGSYLADVRDEYNRFFVGPSEPPALPWESTYVGNETMVFQASTLEVREAYRAQGLRTARGERMPDDHVSTMCAFMSVLSQRTLEAFRVKEYQHVRELLSVQHRFVREHLESWLPDYAQHALRVQQAFLYPQLAQGVSEFALLDGRFLVQAMLWFEEVFGNEALAGDIASYDPGSRFDSVGAALAKLNDLQLRGIGDNEVVPIG